MQNELSLSKSTVISIFNTLDKPLQKYELTLIRKRNHGCYIQGNEQNIREAIRDYLMSCMGDVILYNIIGNNPRSLSVKPQINSAEMILNLCFQGIDLSHFSNFFRSCYPIQKFHQSDTELVSFFLSLLIQTKRVLERKLLDERFIKIESRGTKIQEQFIQTIYQKISIQYNIQFNEIEKQFIKNQIPRFGENKYINTEPDPGYTVISNDLNLGSYQDYNMAVVEFVRIISSYLHPSLAVDSEFIANVEDHLICRMLDKDQHNFLGENSLLDEIKNNYINIFSTINLHKNILTGFLKIDIPAIDLGYLTIYTAAAMERLFIQMTKKKVIVFCNTDQSLASLMTSRLYAEIQGLDIRVVSSILELTQVIQTAHHDLIVTTIPFEISGHPIVVVNPIMKDTDLLNIRKILGIQTNKELSTHYKDKIHLVDLLTTKTITLQVSAENWREAVDCSCARLIKYGYNSTGYLESIKNIITLYGPIMALWPGAILLHASPQDGVRQLCMSLTTFIKPVFFGHDKNDPIEIAIVLGAIDSRSHLIALRELNKLIQNYDAVQKIRKVNHPASIISLLMMNTKSVE